MYLSTSPNGDVFTAWTSKNRDEGLPQFIWKNITYGDYTDTRVINFDIEFPDVRPLFISKDILVLMLVT